METNCNGFVDEGKDFDNEKSYHVERSSLSGEADDTAKSQCENKANLTYDIVEDEPEIHLRTWIALAAMFLLNFVQIIALQGPPVVLDNIGASLHDTPAQTWVPNALSLVQAVLAPILSTASDTFQSRKLILVATTAISFVGSAIAPGSESLGRLIAAQVLIGFGFASTGLAYCVPSEILPRKWRPLIQSFINVAAALGACVGPLIIGALTRNDPVNGWRNYYWIQMAFWGMTSIFIFAGYRPSKRLTRYENLSIYQKVTALDLPGVFLFTAGLTLFLVGLNLGGGLFLWTDARTLATLIVGLIVLLCFCAYEWLGTQTGMVHHDLFRGEKRAGLTISIYLVLIFIEGIMLFSYIIFFPVLTTSLFEADTFLLAAREQSFWVGGGISTVCWGYWSVKSKSIRVPLFTGFLIFTAGIVSFTTIQPSDSTRSCIFAGLAGIGFGAPLILIIAGIQLAAPHSFIATGTSLAIATRAVSSTVFTAIYSAVLSEHLQPNIINHVSKAAIANGLPIDSVKLFVEALAAQNTTALAYIPGITPQIIAAGIGALKQAFADTLRVIFIIAAPFGALACILCFFLEDPRDGMTYQVDAPIEELHVRHRHSNKK